MNKWVLLAVLTAGIVAFGGSIVTLLGWLARRHGRRHETIDDGDRLMLGSALDHLAIDQAHDDADPHS